jgi:hypothetical protein
VHCVFNLCIIGDQAEMWDCLARAKLWGILLLNNCRPHRCRRRYMVVPEFPSISSGSESKGVLVKTSQAGCIGGGLPFPPVLLPLWAHALS